MLYSITDIGSNTVKMNIFDTSLPGCKKLRPVFAESITLKLASMRENGCLSHDGVELLCDVLLKYKDDSKKYGSDNFHTFATASIRNISNTEEVKKAIFAATGIQVDILSGEDEANLSFVGMKGEYPDTCHGLMVDMGGGSTELIAFDGSAPTASVSMPIGCVMLKSEFVQNGTFPSDTEQTAISGRFDKMLDCGLPVGSFSDAYLVGGTARALFRLALASADPVAVPEHKKDISKTEAITLRGRKFAYRSGYSDSISARHSISADDFASIYNIYREAYKDPFAAGVIKAAVPERLDTVVPGMAAINCICKRYKIQTLHLVTSGVREGYLTKLLSEAQYEKTQTKGQIK